MLAANTKLVICEFQNSGTCSTFTSFHVTWWKMGWDEIGLTARTGVATTIGHISTYLIPLIFVGLKPFPDQGFVL